MVNVEQVVKDAWIAEQVRALVGVYDDSVAFHCRHVTTGGPGDVERHRAEMRRYEGLRDAMASVLAEVDETWEAWVDDPWPLHLDCLCDGELSDSKTDCYGRTIHVTIGKPHRQGCPLGEWHAARHPMADECELDGVS